jgi:hypothetical protein
MAKRKINKKLVAKNNSTRKQRKEAERRANAKQDANDAKVAAKKKPTLFQQVKANQKTAGKPSAKYTR